MNFFSKLFTWWNGATIGTLIALLRGFDEVGADAQGNVYYRARRKPSLGTSASDERRWVIYNGANDASRVPPEWHGWLHHQYDALPESHLPPARIWEVEPSANATGTPAAYRPKGALERGGRRARAHADYQAWTPDA